MGLLHRGGWEDRNYVTGIMVLKDQLARLYLSAAAVEAISRYLVEGNEENQKGI
jgi:hypothetical protein